MPPERRISSSLAPIVARDQHTLATACSFLRPHLSTYFRSLATLTPEDDRTTGKDDVNARRTLSGSTPQLQPIRASPIRAQLTVCADSPSPTRPVPLASPPSFSSKS